MRYTGSVYSQTIWEPLGCTMVKVDLDSIEAAMNSQGGGCLDGQYFAPLFNA